MSGSTWTWIDNDLDVDNSGDWVLTSGPGNVTGIPQPGDTVNNTGYPSGAGVIDASIVNDGGIYAYAGGPGDNVLEVGGALSGSGYVYLENGSNPGLGVFDAGAVLQLDSSVSSGQTIEFDGGGDPREAPTLRLNDPTAFSGALVDFDSDGDILDLVGETVTGVSVDGSTLTVSVTSGGPLTFALGFGAPTANELFFRGSDVGILPSREFDWTGASGTNFATAGNWNDVTDGENPALAVPGAQDLASFTNAGLITGGGIVYELSFSGANTMAGTVSGTSSLLVYAGSLAVTGSLSALAASIYGTVSVASGGRVTATNDVYLAPFGVLSVDGGSAVEVGSAGGDATGAITIDSGEELDGDGTLAAAVVNNGYIYAEGGSAGDNVMEIAGALTGTGYAYVESGYQSEAGVVLQLDSSVASAQTVYFFSGAGPAEAPTLRLLDPSAFAGILEDFNGPGDTLDLVGETVTGASVNGTTLTVSVAGGGPLTFNLNPYGEPTTSQLFASGSEVRLLPAREFDWTGADSSNFATAGNWDDVTDGLDPAIAVPGTRDLAAFANNSVVGGGGTVYALSSTGTNTVTGTVVALDVLTVTGGPLLVTGSLSAASVTLNGGTLSAVSGGRVTVAAPNGIELNAGDLISVDPNSSIEFGSAGIASAGRITVDSNVSVYGSGTLSGAVANNGAIEAEPGSSGYNTFDITGALTGSGYVYVYSGYSAYNEAGAVLQLGSSVASAQSVYFSGGSDASVAPTLILTDPSAFAGTLDDFDGVGDTLDLQGQTVTGAAIVGSTMTVTTTFGGPFTFNLSNTPASTYLTVSGSDVIVAPAPVKVWTGAQSTNFGTAGNWNDITNNLTPAAAAPGHADNAEFLTGGGTITGTGTVGQLRFAGSAPWSLSNAGSLAANGGLAVSGDLTIENGASIVNTGGSVTVDGTNGAKAMLTVTGAGSVLVDESGLDVADMGGGTLAAVNGGSVTALGLILGTSGSSAVVSVDATSRIEIGSANTAVAGSLAVDAAGEITGDGTLAAAVANNGTIVADAAVAGSNVLEITGAVTGTGSIYLADGYGPDNETGAVLQVDSSVAGAQSIAFDYASDPAEAETLRLEDPSAFAGTLDSFDSSGDTLDLVGETVTGASVSGSTLTVSVTAGGTLTFNLGYGAPTNSELFVSGSDVGILPARELDWTGANSDNFATAGNWNDVTDGLNPAIIAPGTQDLASLTNAGLIGGNGTVYQVSFTGTNTVAGTLVVLNALTTTGGSLTVTGSLNAASASVSGILSVVSGGRVTENGSPYLGTGDIISVDSTSLVEIGSVGGATVGRVTVDANQSISGDGTLAAPLVNNGDIYVYDSVAGSNVMSITGALTGSGLIYLDEGYAPYSYAGAVLQLGSSVASTQSIFFYSAAAPTTAPALRLSDPAAFAGSLDNFTSQGDTLDLVGDTVTGTSIVGSTLTVSVAGGAPLAFSLLNTPASTPLTYSGDQVVVAAPPRTLVWTGASSTVVSNPSNWDDTTDALNPAATAPAALDTAEFNGGGGPLTGTGTAATLLFGGESAWDLTSGANLSASGSIVVGSNQMAVLAIDAGASLTTTGLAGLVIANTASASGSSVDVSGAGSTLGVAGALIVGGAGYGALSLSQGGVVTAASLDAASGLGGDGVISVAGTGSALTLTGSLTVGDQGAGEVSVLNGATVSALDVTIGNASTLSSGNVDVEGAGSELFVGTGGVLNVGVAGGGSGVLTIGAGTTLHSNAGVIEAGHASFNNNGGVVDPPFVDITTQSNSGLGSNLYDLYVENIGAVQIVSGTGTWDTPMLLTGTSVADAQNNIDVNGDQGEWQLSSGGTLIVNANTVDSGQAIVFEDATDTLVIGQIVNNGAAGVSGTAPVVEPGAENLLQAGGFAAAIWGYQTGDDIDFANMTVSSASVVNGNTVDLFGPGAVSLGSLAFFTKSGSKASDAGAAAAALQIPVQCFAEGTRIATADGPVRVEALRVGDRVVLADGWTGRAGAGSGARIDGAARPRESAPIVWLGHRAVNCRAHPKPETVWPVRVAAGAFGAGVPARDLYLSPDHAVFVNGVLVPVRLLLDGTRIARARRDHVRYFHVELPRHAVILAEGLTVESYLDTGARADFHHDRGTIRLFPDFAERLAAAEAWETRGAAKLVVTGADLAAARRAVVDASSGGGRAIPEDARADDDRAAVRG